MSLRKGWKPDGRDRRRRARFTIARSEGCARRRRAFVLAKTSIVVADDIGPVDLLYAY